MCCLCFLLTSSKRAILAQCCDRTNLLSWNILQLNYEFSSGIWEGLMLQGMTPTQTRFYYELVLFISQFPGTVDSALKKKSWHRFTAQKPFLIRRHTRHFWNAAGHALKNTGVRALDVFQLFSCFVYAHTRLHFCWYKQAELLASTGNIPHWWLYLSLCPTHTLHLRHCMFAACSSSPGCPDFHFNCLLHISTAQSRLGHRCCTEEFVYFAVWLEPKCLAESHLLIW